MVIHRIFVDLRGSYFQRMPAFAGVFFINNPELCATCLDSWMTRTSFSNKPFKLHVSFAQLVYIDVHVSLILCIFSLKLVAFTRWLWPLRWGCTDIALATSFKLWTTWINVPSMNSDTGKIGYWAYRYEDWYRINLEMLNEMPHYVILMCHDQVLYVIIVIFFLNLKENIHILNYIWV